MTQLEGKKILYIITQSKYGGAQRYVLQLARHFKQHNTVLIAVGESENKDENFFNEARGIGIEPIIVESLIRDISLVKAFDAVMEIRKLLAKERPEILHANSSMAGTISSAAAWLYRFDPLNKLIRVFYTVHGFVFNEPMTKMRRRIYLFIERFSANWKHALITVSKYDKEQGLNNRIAPDHKMTVIHNGIDPLMNFLDRSEARKKLGLPEDALIIGAVASLYPVKNLQVLIESFETVRKEMPGSQCVIVGSGPEKKKLEDLIFLKKLEKTIKIIDPIPQFRNLMKAFDVFALPSIKEGFPYVLLEAGLAGVPIVATHVGGIPELIPDTNHGLLVAPDDMLAFAAALLKQLRDPAGAQERAAKLQNRIKQGFSELQMFEATEKLYLKFFDPSATVTPKT